MVKQFNYNTNLISGAYIKFRNFDNLYYNFTNKANKQDFPISENNNLNYDKFLLTVIVGCIEGNFQVDLDNNTWNILFGEFHAEYKVDGNKKMPYILLSMYEFVKNNSEYCNLITNYYNLWHNNSNNDNLEFTYDEYHILNINENFQNLISLMDKDMYHASENFDINVVLSYEILYNVLIQLFCTKKILN